MSLSPEEIAVAETMHDFVRRYPNQYSTKNWILFYGGSVFGFSYLSLRLISHGWFGAGNIFLGAVLALFFITLILQFVLRFRYRQTCVLLQILEREHSDQLPWIEVEKQEAEIKKHLAAVKDLEQELANRHVTP